MTTTTILVVGVLVCEAISPGFWMEFAPWKLLVLILGWANFMFDMANTNKPRPRS